MQRFLAIIVAIYWIGFAAVKLQDKKPDPPKTKTASVELQRDILREQLAAKQIQADYSACQARNWQQEFNIHQLKVNELADKAFKDAGLDKKDYDLNFDTFEFVKKEKK